MAPPQKKELYTDLGQVIFTALLALGFNASAVEQKEKLHINQHMFKRISQKAGDQILHFLFMLINQQEATEKFRDCWPIYDKRTESQFRTTIFEWFKLLNQNEEFNLKTVSVISKAVVIPTSNKFIPTIFNLSRFALHSQINQRDPSVKVLLQPILATNVKQRQRAMHCILSSKVHHIHHYFDAVSRRAKMLSLLQEKSRQLLNMHKDVLKTRESVQQKITAWLKESHCGSSVEKTTFLALPFDEFREEMNQAITLKNREIGALWAVLKELKKAEEEAWLKISDIITGNISLTTINESDYRLADIETYRKEGRLDLVSMARICSFLLKSVKDHIKANPHSQNEARDEAREAEKELKRVHCLQDDTKYAKASFDLLLPPLMSSVVDLRSRIDALHTTYSSQTLWISSGNFNLCPPTPILSLERSLSSKELMDSSHNLRESHVKSPDLDRYTRNGIYSHIPVTCQKQQISNNQQTHHTINSTTELKILTPSINSSSIVDSGCILSQREDSLLQSLEILDITPKGSKMASLQYGSCDQSSKSLEASQRKSLFAHKRVSIIEKSFLGERHIFDSGSRSVLTPSKTNSFLSSQSFSKKRASKNAADDIFREQGNQRGWLSSLTNEPLSDSDDEQERLFESENSSCTSDGNSILKRTTDISETHKEPHGYDVTLTKNLLMDLKTEEYSSKSNDKLDLLDEDWEEAKRLLSCSNDTPIHSATPTRGSVPGNLRSIMNPSVSSNIGRSPSLWVGNRDRDWKDFCCSVNSSSLLPQKDSAHINMCASMASLEFLLDQVEEIEESHSYNITANSFTSKILLNSAKDFSHGRKCAEDSEVFIDSKTFLDRINSGSQKSEVSVRLLSKGSVFDSMTEALAAGELEADLLLDDDVDAEVKRESLNISSRDSILSFGHHRSGESSRLSQLFSCR